MYFQFLPPGTLAIPTDNLQFPDDDDFKEDCASSNEPEEFTVMGISSAHVYECCPNTSKMSLLFMLQAHTNSAKGMKYINVKSILPIHTDKCKCNYIK